MVQMSLLLFEFVQWVESSYGHPQNRKSSDFAIEPPQGTLAMAEMAFEAGLNSNTPVILTIGIPLKSIIASLVLRRAGIKIEQIYKGNFTDEQFDALTSTLTKLRKSNLVIISPDGQFQGKADNVFGRSQQDRANSTPP